MKSIFTRKLMALTAAAVLLVSSSNGAYAAEPIRIFIDGVELHMDVPPKIINDRTMIPVRAVSEAVGCTVDWYGEDKRVVVNSPAGGDPIIVMYVGDPVVTVNTYNGNTGVVTGKRVTIDSPPVIISGRTLVPIRFVAETIGFTVEWENGTVFLNSALYDSPGRGDPGDANVPNSNGKNADSGKFTAYQYSLRLDFEIDGLVWESGNEYTLDGEVNVYSDNLGGSKEIKGKIADYLRLQNVDVSEWLSISMDEILSKKVGYPVWIAEYRIGKQEDTNQCLDAVVLAGEFNGRDYALILHTIRDADLDMNTDTDFDAKIRELFATIEVVTV